MARGEKMTIGELLRLPPGQPVWVLHTPHGVEAPTYDRPIVVKYADSKWEGEGLILDPFAAKDYEWTNDSPLDWWGEDGHYAVFRESNS